MSILYFLFVHIWLKHRLWQSYQSVKHKRVKRFTVWVLHHNVEEGVQSVLQKLSTQTHTDYKTKMTTTVRCVSVFLQEMWKPICCQLLGHMPSTLMSAVIQLMLNDNRPRTTRQLRSSYTVQNLKHVHSLCSTLSTLFHKVRAFRKWHVLIIITVVINQSCNKSRFQESVLMDLFISTM